MYEILVKYKELQPELAVYMEIGELVRRISESNDPVAGATLRGRIQDSPATAGYIAEVLVDWPELRNANTRPFTKLALHPKATKQEPAPEPITIKLADGEPFDVHVRHIPTLVRKHKVLEEDDNGFTQEVVIKDHLWGQPDRHRTLVEVDGRVYAALPNPYAAMEHTAKRKAKEPGKVRKTMRHRKYDAAKWNPFFAKYLAYTPGKVDEDLNTLAVLAATGHKIVIFDHKSTGHGTVIAQEIAKRLTIGLVKTEIPRAAGSDSLGRFDDQEWVEPTVHTVPYVRTDYWTWRKWTLADREGPVKSQPIVEPDATGIYVDWRRVYTLPDGTTGYEVADHDDHHTVAYLKYEHLFMQDFERTDTQRTLTGRTIDIPHMDSKTGEIFVEKKWLPATEKYPAKIEPKMRFYLEQVLNAFYKHQDEEQEDAAFSHRTRRIVSRRGVELPVTCDHDANGNYIPFEQRPILGWKTNDGPTVYHQPSESSRFDGHDESVFAQSQEEKIQSFLASDDADGDSLQWYLDGEMDLQTAASLSRTAGADAGYFVESEDTVYARRQGNRGSRDVETAIDRMFGRAKGQQEVKDLSARQAERAMLMDAFKQGAITAKELAGIADGKGFRDCKIWKPAESKGYMLTAVAQMLGLSPILVYHGHPLSEDEQRKRNQNRIYMPFSPEAKVELPAVEPAKPLPREVARILRAIHHMESEWRTFQAAISLILHTWNSRVSLAQRLAALEEWRKQQ